MPFSWDLLYRQGWGIFKVPQSGSKYILCKQWPSFSKALKTWFTYQFKTVAFCYFSWCYVAKINLFCNAMLCDHHLSRMYKLKSDLQFLQINLYLNQSSFGSDVQSIGLFPWSSRYLFAWEKCLQPKKPLWAESGDGWGPLITQCRFYWKEDHNITMRKRNWAKESKDLKSDKKIQCPAGGLEIKSIP